MEKNPYLTIMIQSLKKKSAVLDAVIELNIRQKEELENPGLDPDDFDACVEEKAKQIEQLELLDTGFQEVYDKIKADLQTNQQEYREEIAEMQEYIRRLTDKSATIQAQEARNKDLMTQKFASVRKQVKEVRKSQKVVNQYYKSMMKSGYMEPQFTDNKKIIADSKKIFLFSIKYRDFRPIYITSKQDNNCYLRWKLKRSVRPGEAETTLQSTCSMDAASYSRRKQLW